MKRHFIEGYSKGHSPIHLLDARAKLVATVGFMLAVVFTPLDAARSFVLYAAYLLAVVLISRVPVAYIMKRMLIVLPFVAMVAVFIPFFKDGTVVRTVSVLGWNLTITREGLDTLLQVAVKSGLCTASAVVLMATTDFAALIQAMEGLKLPRLFSMIMAFMYRYLFLFLDELEVMQRAKSSRSCGGSRWLNLKATANMAGMLFIRAYERGEAVYLAMCSRGFDGRIRTMQRPRLAARDIVFLAVSLAFMLGARFANDVFAA